ncbi:MAG: alpha/beta fold hydrolase [Bdellovibrionota bacterium]
MGVAVDSFFIGGFFLIFGLVALGFVVYVWLNRGRPNAIPPSHPPESIEELVPESRYIEVDGVKLHYIQAGEGSDVVLLHGIGASIFIWRFLFPILQMRHRLTAIDIAGFGKSAKEARLDYGLDSQTELLLKAVEKIGIEKAFLVGSSMGGAIALWMARRAPEIFEKVAALAPATDASLVSPFVHRLAPFAPFFKPTMTRATMKRLLSAVITKRELITEDALDKYLEPFRERASFRTFIAATSLLSDRRLPSQLVDLKSRVLVIWGAGDLSVPRRSIDRLMTILPSAELVVHESGGHHIMEDEPVWLAKQLEVFFAG